MPLISMSQNKERSVQKSSISNVYFGNSKNILCLLRLVLGSHSNMASGAELKTVAPIKGKTELLKLIKPKFFFKRQRKLCLML